MAAYYVVLLHKATGVIGGAFTNLVDAQAFVGTAPNCGYEIQSVTVDAAIGTVVSQGGKGTSSVMSTGPGLNNVGA